MHVSPCQSYWMPWVSSPEKYSKLRPLGEGGGAGTASTSMTWQTSACTDFFNQEGFRGSEALVFWRLWVGIQPWGPGTVSGITLPLTDFSLCPRFLFPFLLSPFIGHCLVRLLPTKTLFFRLTFLPVCKACKLLHWPWGVLYSRVVVPPCGVLYVAMVLCLPACLRLAEHPRWSNKSCSECGSLLKAPFPNYSFFLKWTIVCVSSGRILRWVLKVLLHQGCVVWLLGCERGHLWWIHNCSWSCHQQHGTVWTLAPGDKAVTGRGGLLSPTCLWNVHAQLCGVPVP